MRKFAVLVVVTIALAIPSFAGNDALKTPAPSPGWAQVYPAPPNVGLLAARPTFCALTGQQYYATDNTTLYYATVAGTSCTWTAVGGSGGGASFTSLTAGTNTNTGVFSFSQSGVFTNTQINGPNVLGTVNSCSPNTEYQGIGFSGLGFQTDAVDGCITVPNTSTALQTNAIAGYTSNAGTTTNAVAGFFGARALANNAPLWGLNPVCADGGFTGVFCQSIEADINILSADATESQSNSQDGVRIVSGGTKRPRAALTITNVNSTNMFKIGIFYKEGGADTSSSNSFIWYVPQDDLGTIAIHGRNHADSGDTWTIANNGTFTTPGLVLNGTTGFSDWVEGSTIAGGAGNMACSAATADHFLHCNANGTNLHKAVMVSEFGQCAMGSATTCTFSATHSFSGTPLCFVTATTSPATADAGSCAISGTTVTITAGISNSLTWNALLVGNPD